MAAAPVSSPPRRAGRGLRYLLILLLLAFAGMGLWTWLTLAWSYSDGTRAGLLQKFSHKGWFCKTQEGDLVLAQFAVVGVAPQIWHFSVRDKTLGTQLEKVVGKSVRLHYTEHPGVPSTCFGDTRYFVDGVVLTDEGSTAPSAAPPGPTAAPSSGTAQPSLPGTQPSPPGTQPSPPSAAPAVPARPLSPAPPPATPPNP